MSKLNGVILKDVTKRFGDVTAVDAMSLNIDEGEFVSILGPSGCGKTTLLRMLAGLEQATAGEISIAGRPVNDVPPGKRDIAMVFQTYALYPHMTVRGNIEYPLRKRRLAKSERQRRVDDTARLLELEGLLERKPRELSGGQQQRVALGRALVRDPAVFLFDEPLSNLDAKLRSHMRAELIRLHQRVKRTMIYVTHDQLEAMSMSQRIAVIRHGRLQQFASPADIYERPNNEFIASFIGTPSMNIVDVTLRETNGSIIAECGEWSLTLPAQLLPGGMINQQVKLGLRPEHIVVGDDGLAAKVSVVEPTGHESIVVFDCSGIELKARVAADIRLQAGDDVKLQFRHDRIHLFSAADGSRPKRR